jgi:hypothetical protein
VILPSLGQCCLSTTAPIAAVHTLPEETRIVAQLDSAVRGDKWRESDLLNGLPRRALADLERHG